jgi:uncharacterized protein DUF6719
MQGNRNILYLIIGALIVAVGVLGYNLYQTRKEPEGLQINCRAERTEDPEQVKQGAAQIMKSSLIKRFSLPLLSLFALAVLATSALAQQTVAREQDIVGLRLGQRIHVDDGSCPAGQVKEVSGARMTATGVLAAQKCVPRLGPKKK